MKNNPTYPDEELIVLFEWDYILEELRIKMNIKHKWVTEEFE